VRDKEVTKGASRALSEPRQPMNSTSTKRFIGGKRLTSFGDGIDYSVARDESRRDGNVCV
jgi:hypothetical protein